MDDRSDNGQSNPVIADGLDFEALLYVTGELDPVAADRLERRLAAGDLPLAEAVADAVEWLELIAAAESRGTAAEPMAVCSIGRAGGTRQAWFRTIVAVVTTAAALLAAVKLLPPTDTRENGGEFSTPALAMVWAETQEIVTQEIGAEELVMAAWSELEPSVAIAGEVDSSEQLDAETIVGDESWIAAAIEGMAGDLDNGYEKRGS